MFDFIPGSVSTQKHIRNNPSVEKFFTLFFFHVFLVLVLQMIEIIFYT